MATACTPPNLGGGGTVHFSYDASGQRVRKICVSQAGTSTWERIYRLPADWSEASASITGIEAGYSRRKQDWEFQQDQAERELARLKEDVVVAKARVRDRQAGAALLSI